MSSQPLTVYVENKREVLQSTIYCQSTGGTKEKIKKTNVFGTQTLGGGQYLSHLFMFPMSYGQNE